MPRPLGWLGPPLSGGTRLLLGTLHRTIAIEPQYQGHWHLVSYVVLDSRARTERILIHRRSNEHSKHTEKANTKRTLKRPQHIHSLLSRFSLQPPFIEVLSGLLRAAYWPLVFSFSSFSGLFWPGPFSPFFASGFQNGAKECIV